jgi:uncharacterized protein YbjT (DUF2867 family)
MPTNARLHVVIFGATGMVGRGVLRECLLDDGVERVLTVGRRITGEQDPKLRELVVPDPGDLRAIEPELARLDACFFCLGVSALGLSEAEYTRVTHDLTLGAARTLVGRNPGLTFVYVSGQGTDSSERGRQMWARVKGRTENALLGLPFRAAYMFRPGIIQPMHGVRSSATITRVAYAVLAPVIPALRRAFPNAATTTEQMGRAMLAVVRRGYPRPVLDNRDINGL